MKALNQHPILKQTLLWAGTIGFCVFFVWYGLQLAPPVFAQATIGNPTPTPNCAPTATPPSESLVALPTCIPCVTPAAYAAPYRLIPDLYQDPDLAKLAWVVSTPTPAPASSPPAIVLIHGGSWYSGDATDIGYVAQDLAKAGYYVVSVNYELARCGLIPGQICHEYDDPTAGAMVKRQTDDIKAFVVALAVTMQLEK